MVRFNELPLRLTLSFGIILASLLTLSSALITSYTLSKEHLISEQAKRYTTLYQGLAAIAPGQIATLSRYLEQQPEVRAALIRRTDLPPITLVEGQFFLSRQTLPLAAQDSFNSADRSLEITTPLPSLDEGGPPQWLQVKLNIDHAIDDLRRQYLVVALLFSVIGILGIYFVTRTLRKRITRPLEVLALNADLISRGEYTTQSFYSGLNEIGKLAQALNKIGEESTQHLEKIEKRNQQLMSFLHCGIIALVVEDEHDHFVETNDNWLSLSGLNESCLYHTGWADIVHPDQLPELMTFKSLLKETNDEAEAELRIITPQGEDRWIHVVAKRLPPHEDEPSINLYFVRDIHLRKQYENELKLAAVAFETQEAIVVADADTHILKVNQAFTRITGYTPEEAIGSYTNLLRSGYHDRDFYQAMWKALEEKGRWQGEIWNRKKSGITYPQWQTITAVKNEAGRITNYIACFQDISERKRAEEEIKKLAYYDELTGLPNRRMFYKRLNQAVASSQRSGMHGSLLFIDLDHFKDVNDSLGHLVGDKLLQEVSIRLNDAIRAEDTLARLGGDEFVIMLENLGMEYEAASTSCQILAERIIQSLSRPCLLGEHTVRITASIGISIFPTNSLDIDDLLRQADTAMYKSKASGRSTLRFYSQEMQHQANARMQLRNDLEQALKDNQFRLFLQPQVDIPSGKIKGAESLIRWQHPERGLLSPGEFLPIAEGTDLIIQIGLWTLAEASRVQAAFAQSGECFGRISVNIDPTHFHRADFVPTTLKIIQDNGAKPEQICLEITEGVAIDNHDDVARKIDQLQSTGILVALDDFGTGYSSLSYLINLHAKELKLDRTFIMQLTEKREAQLMVKSIITLANQLNIQVVAEGVETPEQLGLLRELGCPIMQGYLESHPLSCDDFSAYLGNRVALESPAIRH